MRDINFNKLHSCTQLLISDFDSGECYAETKTPAGLAAPAKKANSPQSCDVNNAGDVNKNFAVILGYYNGNKYLAQQIRSILDQSHSDVEVFISDDCSDFEVDIKSLDLAPKDTKRIRLGVRSANVGFTDNFLGALSSIDDSFKYYAFSDQDDIWYQDKIQKALVAIEAYPDRQPVLYCSRTEITDESCQNNLGSSPLFEKAPSFANALVQNIGGGNTMVFNRAARDLIVESSKNVNVVSHDWWCYQIISGAGGIVHYDPKPCLKYRQHNGNLVGSNNDWLARLIRLKRHLNGRFRDWNDINLNALTTSRLLLTADNQQRLDDFKNARDLPLIKRLILFKRTGIYRQSFLGNLGLVVSLILNKV